MAELTVNTFNKGMNQDVLPRFQPQGSYRYALNATLMSRKGSRPAIINELGNKFCKELPYPPIGAVLLGSDEFVIFSTNDLDSEIGLFNSVSKTYSTLINSPCLNFNSAYPVDAQWRLIRGCDRVVYFTDTLNNYRVLNIDDLDFYKTEDGLWDCEKLDLSRSIQSPTINVESVDDFGGNLKIGSYQFAIRYLDKYLNPTPWLFITRPVNIVDENLSDDYYTIDGGVNVISSLDEEGAVEPSTKAINLSIDSLDSSFDYYQIAVAASTSSTGVVSNVYILPEQDISTSSFSVRSLLPDTGAIQTELGEIQESNIIPEIVGTHTQLDNHLYLGNLSFRTYDWAEFQRSANEIGVSVVTNTVQVNQNVNEIGNAKNPVTPFEAKSLVGDEIYALSVQYQIKGYKWSPAFHIPGRVKNSEDSQLIDYTEDNPDLKPLPQKEQYETWEVYNTALSTTKRTSYYETDVSYPNSLDCNGQRIFPEGNIRHHKMPSRRDIPLYSVDGDNVLANLLGLRFDIDSYPHPDVTGHRFLVSKRDASNMTVLDMGVIIGGNPEAALTNRDPRNNLPVLGVQFENLETDLRNPPSGASSSTLNAYQTAFLFSPRTLSERVSLSNTYFSVIGRLQLNSTSEDRFSNASINGGGGLEYRTRINNYLSNLDSTSQQTINYSSSTYFGNRVMQRPTTNLPLTVFNRSYSNTYSAHYMDTRIQDQPGKYVVNIKRFLRPYTNLATIEYVPLHSNPLNLDSSQTVYGGDVYISEFRVLDLANVDQASGNRTIHYASKMDGLWVESPINYELRYSGDNTCKKVYTQGERLGNYWLVKTATPTENSTKYDLRETYCPEYYGNNRDFSGVPAHIPAVALPLTFDYCLDCGEIFPRRIIRSSKSFEEFTSDAYRIFPANDYIDLPGKDKSLTALVVDKDQLYGLTENGPYFIPTRPQTLSSSEDNVYLTTGSTAFSIPPRKLVSVNYPYGGCSDKFSIVSTEFGTFYVDRKSGKIFNLSSELMDIAALGMNSFFEENTTLRLDDRFINDTGSNYPIKNTTHVNGIGYISTFDTRLRRVIFTKKDYDFIDPELFDGILSSEEQLQLNPGKIYFDPSSSSFVRHDIESGVKNIDVDDTSVFQNFSWTVSFSLDDKVWASFHSYTPSFYMFDEARFYSTVNSSNIWVHNMGNYQTYYDVKQDFIIDLIDASRDTTHEYHAMMYSSYSELNDVDVDLPTQTFDRIVVYNTQQSSGLQDLVSNIGFNATVDGVTIKRTDKYWKVNGFRDLVSDYSVPLFSDNWTDIANSYPIDKVVNPAAFGPKSNFELPRFRDRYLGIRLFAKPEQNIRLTTDTVLVAQKNSFR